MDKTNTQAFESGEIVRRLKIQLPLAGMLVATVLLSGCGRPRPPRRPPEKPAAQTETSTATETSTTTEETATTTESATTTETDTGEQHYRGPRHHHVPPKNIRKPAPRPMPPPPPPRNYKNESHKPVTPGRQPVPPPPYKK